MYGRMTSFFRTGDFLRALVLMLYRTQVFVILTRYFFLRKANSKHEFIT